MSVAEGIATDRPHEAVEFQHGRWSHSNVFDLAQITDFVDAIVLPMIGCCTLFHAKFGSLDSVQSAQRRFLAVLIVMALVTLRTVIRCDEAWLVHTTALATLIIASLMIPGHQISPAA